MGLAGVLGCNVFVLVVSVTPIYIHYNNAFSWFYCKFYTIRTLLLSQWETQEIRNHNSKVNAFQQWMSKKLYEVLIIQPLLNTQLEINDIISGGSMSSIGEFEIQGYAIVFTDNSSENTTTALDLGLYPAYSYSYLDSAKNAAVSTENPLLAMCFIIGSLWHLANRGNSLFCLTIKQYNRTFSCSLRKIWKEHNFNCFAHMRFALECLLIREKLGMKIKVSNNALLN